ncbi:hypothetical protein AgCh_009681 [Apium graveolens]
MQGAFEIISITGTVFSPPASPGSGGLSIFLSGEQWQILEGNVVGPLITTCTIILLVASFANGVFDRISLEEHDISKKNDINGGYQVHEVQPVTSQASMTKNVGVIVP